LDEWERKKRGEERRGDMIMEYRMMYCPAYRSGVHPQL
jgi:hypothetical protein